MVDDAAGIPPFSNFTRFPKLGVDLFCTSGGKGMMGPQVSGLLCGRKDLIDAALLNTTPSSAFPPASSLRRARP